MKSQSPRLGLRTAIGRSESDFSKSSRQSDGVAVVVVVLSMLPKRMTYGLVMVGREGG